MAARLDSGRWAGHVSAWAAAFSAAVGVLVLVGWTFDVPALTSIRPHFVAMKANTALCFLLSGVSLWLAGPARPSRRLDSLRVACAGVVLLIGTLTLGEYLFGRDLGLDQILFTEPPGAIGTSSPGRMALFSALNFMIVGTSLILTSASRGLWTVQVLAPAVGLVGLFSLGGYAYGVEPLYGFAASTPLALHTALAFVALGIGLLFARPDRGLAALLAGGTAGGMMARRLLPAALLIAIVGGYLRLEGERAGFYPTALGVALFALISVVLISAAVLWSAVRLDELDKERHRAEEETRRQARTLQTVLSSMGEGVIVADQAGKFLVWNPAAERLIGLGAKDMPPEEWSREYGLFLPDQRTPWPAERLPLARAIRGEAVDDVEIIVRHRDVPEGRWLSVTGRPLTGVSGAIRGGVVVFRDITAHKRSERDLRQRSIELAAANKELESFSYSVSHDLRGPLRAIDGFSGILIKNYREHLDAEARGHLDRIRAGCKEMGRLIDDLLSLSSVIRTELRVEAVDLAELARLVAERLGCAERDRVVVFSAPSSLPVRGDAGLLRIALENLLGNAWKFTSRQAHPRVEFGTVRQDGETVYVVKDNGAGFDMTYANKLFGAFQRLHSQEEFPGAGIGLATVQRIVRRHGGRVWAESAVGEGASFFFTLGEAPVGADDGR